MTASVVWSPNLRLTIKKSKELKPITYSDISLAEEQAIQKQLMRKSEDLGALSWWA